MRIFIFISPPSVLNPPDPPRYFLHSSLPAVRLVSADEYGLPEGDAATQERDGLVLCSVDEIWKPAAEDDQGIEEGSVGSNNQDGGLLCGALPPVVSDRVEANEEH